MSPPVAIQLCYQYMSTGPGKDLLLHPGLTNFPRVCGFPLVQSAAKRFRSPHRDPVLRCSHTYKQLYYWNIASCLEIIFLEWQAKPNTKDAHTHTNYNRCSHTHIYIYISIYMSISTYTYPHTHICEMAMIPDHTGSSSSSPARK